MVAVTKAPHLQFVGPITSKLIPVIHMMKLKIEFKEGWHLPIFQCKELVKENVCHHDLMINLGSYNLYRFSIHTIDRTDKTVSQIRI